MTRKEVMMMNNVTHQVIYHHQIFGVNLSNREQVKPKKLINYLMDFIQILKIKSKS